MGIKADELEGRPSRSVNDPFDVAVGDANDSVAAAVAATGTTKLKIPLPVLRCHIVLN